MKKDNIKNNIISFSKYFAFIISIVGTLTEIYNIVFVKTTLKSFGIIAVCIVVFLVTLIGLVLNKSDLSVYNKTRSVIFSNKKILHGLRDDYFESKNSLGLQPTLIEKEKIIINFLLPVVKSIQETLKNFTGADVRVCIKIIEFPDNQIKPPLEMIKLKTVCRDAHRSNHDAYNEYMSSAVLGNDNTDFKLILEGKRDFFHVDDLYTLEDKYVYENTSAKWRDSYRSTMVFPIRLCVDNSNKKSLNYDLIGFMCVDSKARTAFIGNIGKVCENFCIGIADTLYVYLKELQEIIYKGMETKKIIK